MKNIARLRRSLYIALFGRRGSFIYEPELGSELYLSYPQHSAEDICTARARDALSCFPGCEVIGVDDSGITVDAEGITLRLSTGIL